MFSYIWPNCERATVMLFPELLESRSIQALGVRICRLDLLQGDILCLFVCCFFFVSICFSCSGQRCDVLLLWSFRGLSIMIGQFFFGWTVPLKRIRVISAFFFFLFFFVSLTEKVGTTSYTQRRTDQYCSRWIIPLLFFSLCCCWHSGATGRLISKDPTVCFLCACHQTPDTEAASEL